MNNTSIKKRKFKDGDYVFDELNGLYGKIESYLSGGYYILTDLCFPIYSINNVPNCERYLKVNSIRCELYLPDSKTYTNTYIQQSRVLSLIDRPIEEDKLVTLSPEKSYTVFDNSYSRLIDIVNLEIQSPLMKRSTINYAIYSSNIGSWIISGSIFPLNISKIFKEEIHRSWYLRSGSIFFVSDELMKNILNWETEVAPFVIKGSLV